MRTIRGRLTGWYATALIGVLAGFALLVYVSQRRASYQELDRRLVAEADLTVAILSGVARVGTRVLEQDAAGRPRLAGDVAAALEAVPEFLVITDRAGRVLFASPAARALTFEQFQQLSRVAVPDAGAAPAEPQTLHLGPPVPELRYVVRRLTAVGPEFGTVLAAAGTAGASLQLEQLTSSLLLMIPVALAAALLIGAWIAGRALAPVDAIITEVQEITDGRSLHRRLPMPLERDEVGRLAETLNEMMARLERSFTALRRFTADASHELKTPLTALRASVERAITHPRVPADVLPVLEDALREVNWMTELVEALLTLARADEGIAPLHKERVDLRLLLDEARETGELLAEDAGVDIVVGTPTEPVTMEVDPSRIRQLLLNLLTNAVKYTPRGGHVSLQLAGANGRAQITVSDTGIGIAPGDLPHIFDRFWRADAARTRFAARPGAGLGLAICKWIAEAHGGTIEVQSRPGRGTTFTVTLPTEG